MSYLEFFTSINPFVLGILAVVIGCGAYDHWIQPRH